MFVLLLMDYGHVSITCYTPLSGTNIALVLSISPLSPLRFDAHPLSSLMFCPGDPVQSAVAESSPPHIVPKMYLCLSFLDFGKGDDRTSGMENRPGSGVDSAIPKSELIVCGLFKRSHSHANISEWVCFSLLAPLQNIHSLSYSHRQS
jgi:hypothetical protein